jgi:hypothetical protein
VGAASAARSAGAAAPAGIRQAVHPGRAPAAAAADYLELLALGEAVQASGWPDTGVRGSGGWLDQAFTYGQWIRVGQRPLSKASSTWNAPAHARPEASMPRITQRVLAMAAAIWNNWATGAPAKRSPIAYDN